MEVVNLFGETVDFNPDEDMPDPEAAAEAAELELEEEDEHGEGFGEYNNPIGLTSQFRFCGNPLRADTYRGCDFGCKYCFANARGGPNEGMFQQGAGPANLRSVRNMLKKAYSADATKNSNVEAIRRGVPLHLGGMSDPFQRREWKDKNTVKFLRMTEEYQHPMMISTKTDRLMDEHWELLNPKRHVFQISIMGINREWVKSWETKTPSPADRLAFIYDLKSKGFWVGLRIQPLIKLSEALDLVREVSLPDPLVDYITVEHLKLPMDNKHQRDIVLRLMGSDYKGLYVSITRSAEMRTSIKIKNLERIKEIANGIPVGAGDNDIHELSESRCCCGIDLIGGAFSRWLKYNSTYFMTAPPGENIPREKIWAPTSKVGGCFIGGLRDPKYHMSFRDRVDAYEAELKAGKYANRNAQITLEEFLELEKDS